MGYKKKPRALKSKNIKRRTGARAQSKQIAALSTAVTNMKKTQYETIQTVWTRKNLSVDKLTGGLTAYICPMPKSMGNCFNQETKDTFGQADQRIPWSDTLSLAAQQKFYKTAIFGSSEAARNSPEVTHMGGVLNWRLVNEEPSFSTYSIFLISPKRKYADQLITDRELKSKSGTAAAGSGATLFAGTDFVTHENVAFTQINKKYWNIDGHREVNFSHPGSTGFSNNVNPANTDPMNNAVIATGSFKLKAGGTIKCMNRQLIPLAGVAMNSVNASQLGYVDEQNEKLQYLVIINNGVGADLETVNLSFLVRDYYKAVV